MTAPRDLQIQFAAELSADRWAAHEVLFPHRHQDESCDAHMELVEAIHSPASRINIEGFRGIGKTTYLEEAVVIKACLGEFHNLVFLGASFPRACDRVSAVAHELTMNPLIQQTFGKMKGTSWQDGRIVLSNGVCIQALGRGQSILGIKHLEWRPDAFVMDDLEDPEEKLTDPDREDAWRWLRMTFLPSLDDPQLSWGRFAGTRRGKGSIPERLEAQGVPTVKFPIDWRGPDGKRRATWPGKFPLKKIDEIMSLYRDGMDLFEQEYRCHAVSAEDRPFKPEHIKVVPRVRAWEAVSAMYDPARTVGTKSATTGKAVWSWVKNRLVIWEAGGHLWLPDELIADVFDTAERYGPVWLGVEEDGLNEWIRQPLRHEQVKRGTVLPVKPVRAPRGKLDFIRALQPYFAAGEVELAAPCPDLVAQLLSFPHGRIDAPNALAYALSLRPGMPVYDGFTHDHVAETLPVSRDRVVWLAANATKGLVTAAALQTGMGRTTVLGDWAIEGDPGEAVPLLLREVGMSLRAALTVVCPPEHWAQYTNVGLVQAFRAVPIGVERGAEPLKGRAVLRDDLARFSRGLPAMAISRNARHTLNALAGGYARMVAKGGGLADEPEPGFYRTLMEGIEACLGRMAVAEDADSGENWSYTQDGRRYRQYGTGQRRRA